MLVALRKIVARKYYYENRSSKFLRLAVTIITATVTVTVIVTAVLLLVLCTLQRMDDGTSKTTDNYRQRSEM
jgi:hypothetical protein